jgi:PAS domain S-box-containing protein
MDKEKTLELLLAVIDNMPDHIYIKDINSRFLLANEATAKTMCAKSVDDIIGKTDFDFYPTEFAQKYFDDEQTIIKTGKPKLDYEEANYTEASDTLTWVTSSKVPIKNSEGNIIGIVGISRNITSRKQMQEIMKALEMEELSDQTGKAEIATNVLHDIGNVLNSIYVSAAEVLRILSKSRTNGLKKATDMLEGQIGNLTNFLENDSKGKLLPEYLIKISN